MPADPIITVEHLTAGYEGNVLMQALNFSVHRGEVFAHDVPLQAEVAPGALDGEKERLEPGADGCVAHGGLPPVAV